MKKLKPLIFCITLVCSISFAQEITETISPPEAQESYVDEYTESYDEPNPTPSKEEIGEVYFEKRSLNPDFKDNYKGKKFDYDRVVKQKEIKPPSPPLFNFPTGLFQILMYIVLAAIVLIVIYLIIKNAGGFSFGSEKKKIKFETSDETELEDEENIANNDFLNLIKKAKSDKDFRKAIRYYHLWVLQSLADKKLIHWNKDKTDYDYFLELGQHLIKEDFSNGMYVYDYIWYGNFQLDADQFNIAESIFQRTLNKIR